MWLPCAKGPCSVAMQLDPEAELVAGLPPPSTVELSIFTDEKKPIKLNRIVARRNGMPMIMRILGYSLPPSIKEMMVMIKLMAAIPNEALPIVMATPVFEPYALWTCRALWSRRVRPNGMRISRRRNARDYFAGKAPRKSPNDSRPDATDGKCTSPRNATQAPDTTERGAVGGYNELGLLYAQTAA